MHNRKYDEDVKHYTPQQLQELKDAAKKRFIESQGAVSVKVLARVARVPQGYVRKWLREENWKDLVVEDSGDVVVLSDKTKEFIENSDDFDLDEQERLFCYHYLKTFNATTSAVRAGYSSALCYKAGFKLKNDKRIQKFLKHLKAYRDEELFLDAIDIIKQYMKIAFADMNDFVEFRGQTLIFKDSKKVDGSLISEIKSGRQGISIKLEDRLKALDKLSDYFDVCPDKFRQEIEREKIKLMRERLAIDNANNKTPENLKIKIKFTGGDEKDDD